MIPGAIWTLARAVAHRLRHGRPRSVLGGMATTMRELCGAEMERCGCGAMETSIRGERIVGRARTCPTFELRAWLRLPRLPRAEVIR